MKINGQSILFSIMSLSSLFWFFIVWTSSVLSGCPCNIFIRWIIMMTFGTTMIVFSIGWVIAWWRVILSPFIWFKALRIIFRSLFIIFTFSFSSCFAFFLRWLFIFTLFSLVFLFPLWLLLFLLLYFLLVCIFDLHLAWENTPHIFFIAWAKTTWNLTSLKKII